jgi:hypothetical protein
LFIDGDILLKAHSMLSKVNQLCGGVIAKLRVNTLIKKYKGEGQNKQKI